MKIFIFCCVMSAGTQLFAQGLDGVYFKKVPNRIFVSRFRPYLISVPKHYIYVNLKKDSTMVYINTIGGFERTVEVTHDRYVINGDSIFFEKNFDTGTLTEGKLCIPLWVCKLEEAELSDMEKFITKYGDELKRRNICFQKGYTMPCDTSH